MLHLRQMGSRRRPVVWQWSATKRTYWLQMGQVPERLMRLPLREYFMRPAWMGASAITERAHCVRRLVVLVPP